MIVEISKNNIGWFAAGCIVIVVILFALYNRILQQRVLCGFYDARADFCHEAGLSKYSVAVCDLSPIGKCKIAQIVIDDGGVVLFSEIYEAWLIQTKFTLSLSPITYTVKAIKPAWEKSDLFPHSFRMIFDPIKQQISFYNPTTEEYQLIAYRDNSIEW